MSDWCKKYGILGGEKKKTKRMGKKKSKEPQVVSENPPVDNAVWWVAFFVFSIHCTINNCTELIDLPKLDT